MLTASTLDDIDLYLPGRREGKVRISYSLHGNRRLFVTTDRLSAFDRVIASVPFKGQVLNELSAFWFAETAGILPNHLVEVPDPNVLIARAATPLPVEVVVRGHITGVTSTSLWAQYEAGSRSMYGYRFADDLRKNTALPTPIVTPTTKAPGGATGGHDEPVSCAEVVSNGLVDAELWDRVMAAALLVFDVGRRRAAAAGLILADTKYELGLAVDTGELLLIDEVHTPDSSRYWVAATYEERVARGEEPESLDKENVRRALKDLGYRGDGSPPTLPQDVIEATAARYVDAYERITGARFVPGEQPAEARIARALEGIS